MRALGVIPARGGPKAIQRKNVRLLAGKPLLQYTAEPALAAHRLARVVPTTDDAEIAEVGRACGLDVPFLRPPQLALADTPTLPVLQHAVGELEKPGNRFDAICLLQRTYPLREVSEEVFGQPLTEATVLAANQRIYGHLAAFEQEVKVLLPQAPLVHADESGLPVAGTLHWLHVVCTSCLTFYGVHPRCGRKAMDEFDVLPRCQGCKMHDHLPAYLTYKDCPHALCNEPHLREPTFLHEEHHEAWPQDLSTSFLKTKEPVEREGVPGEQAFKRVLGGHHAILAKGRRHHPACRGSESKAANLLDRLEGDDLPVLAFVMHQEVPFTNNHAERDNRMEKVGQTISGCFRTLHGARRFPRIRIYISTCHK